MLPLKKYMRVKKENQIEKASLHVLEAQGLLLGLADAKQV